jgi:hypothetical protein
MIRGLKRLPLHWRRNNFPLQYTRVRLRTGLTMRSIRIDRFSPAVSGHAGPSLARACIDLTGYVAKCDFLCVLGNKT